MSSHTEDPKRCEAVRDELAELALGILSGRSRLDVIEHVHSCSRCSAELQQLSVLVDNLGELAPEMEPPVGFELRLAERLHAGVPVRHRRRVQHVSALVGAAMILAALGFGVGALTIERTTTANPPTTADLTSAQLTSRGHVLGEVVVSRGSPEWLFMAVDAGTWAGKVTCEVTVAGGHVETIGVFTLSGGYGAWGAPVTMPSGAVRSARLIGPNGTVVASAQLPD